MWGALQLALRSGHSGALGTAVQWAASARASFPHSVAAATQVKAQLAPCNVWLRCWRRLLLRSDAWSQVTTEEQRTDFVSQLNAAEDWLYEEGEHEVG